jgi:hypothetical protein
LIKGGILGAAIGYGAYALDLSGGFDWVTYGAVGVVVGLFVGRPVWSHFKDRGSTIWVSIIKAVFGCGVALGIYALVGRVWGGFDLALGDLGERNLVEWQFLLGGGIGALYGAWLEVDDAPAKKAKAKGADAGS